MDGGTCNLKVVPTENKYFRIPSNREFHRGNLKVANATIPRVSTKPGGGKEGFSYNFTKVHPLNFNFSWSSLTLISTNLGNLEKLAMNMFSTYLIYTI